MSNDGVLWQNAGELKGSGLPGTPLQYMLHSDPNKQTDDGLLPARRLDEAIRFHEAIRTQHFRITMEMEGAAHWDVHELQFADALGRYVEVMPSKAFSSLWMSDGGGEQWLYTDLGKSLPIEKIRMDRNGKAVGTEPLDRE